MTDTANLALPFIDGSQAQKHVTHNEALRILDAAIQIGVLNMNLTAPPPTPANGARHVVALGATGTWAGQANAIATWEDGAWRFLVPKPGWLVWSAADNSVFVFDGVSWSLVSGGGASPTIDNAPRIGVNSTAVSPNLLTVRSNASLFNAITAVDGGTGDARIQISKESATDTASVFFSSAFSGRAEFGLVESDDFKLKVSADGTSWVEAMAFSKSTGKVSFPAGGARELLAADRYYYVRADGGDGNNGLSNVSGGAFRTIQKAIDIVLGTIDFAGFTVTIQIGDGTYAPASGTNVLNLSRSWTGGGSIIIQGNSAAPANVLLSAANADAVAIGVSPPGTLTIKDLKIQTASAGNGINMMSGGTLLFGNLNFGTCAGAHIQIGAPGAKVSAISNYSISGGAAVHVGIGGQGAFYAGANTITLAGTPNFSVRFVNAIGAAYLDFSTASFSGSATGSRYGVFINGMIFSNGGSTSFFPGNAAGVVGSGGIYN